MTNLKIRLHLTNKHAHEQNKEPYSQLDWLLNCPVFFKDLGLDLYQTLFWLLILKLMLLDLLEFLCADHLVLYIDREGLG